MTELERRALLGDAEAQKRCTEQGIVLPCPKCFKPMNVHGPEDWHPTFEDPDSGGDPYSFACECGLVFGMDKYDFKEALADWNTRQATPIGRCGKCDFYVPEWECEGKTIPSECTHPLTELYVINEEDFCSYFTPKEDTK